MEPHPKVPKEDSTLADTECPSHMVLRALGLETHHCLQKSTLKCSECKQHIAARTKARVCETEIWKIFATWFISFHPPCLSKSAKLAMSYVRHTAKHFFTASLGRKNTKFNERSSPQRLLEVVKTLLEISWAPGVACCRAESI